MTAIICEAGPVRVCQNRSRVAAMPGKAAPMVRRSSSGSPRRRIQMSTSQPTAPVAGRAMISEAMRQPCM